MDLEEKQVKDCLKDYLISKGIDIRKNFKCPFHSDNNPSAKYYEDSNTIYCYTCGKHFDIFNLIGLDYNLDNKEAYKKGFELFGNNKLKNNNFSEKNVKEKVKKDFSADYKEWHKVLLDSECALNYLSSRGINKDIMERFNLGFNKEFESIILPKDNYSYNSRTIKEKHYFKQGNSTIYNQSALYNNKTYCIITESEFDCLSFESLGCNAIGLGGATLINKLFETNQLPNDKIYLLALDNDEKGIEATEELKHLLQERNLRYLALDYGNTYKDPNEALTSDFEGFNKVCERVKNEFWKEESKQQYLLNNALNKMNEFDEYVEKTKSLVPFPTGFKSLDDILDGGIKEGLTTIIAIPGIGKTTFTLQIADNVAKQGRDVLIFALEMSRNELIAKSLSRISYEKQTRRGGMFQTSNTFLFGYMQKDLSPQVLDYMQECKEEYKKYAEHLFIDESEAERNIKSIGEIIENHIRITNNTPLVIIDYAQIIAPTKDNMTDKKNMDEIILELKRLTRRLHLPIIAISSINRASYDEVLGLSSAKESGGIEFTSTVLLGLQYKATKNKDNKMVVNIEEEGKKDTRDIELKIIKNRFGKSFKTIDLTFFPELCYFKEKESLRERKLSNF